MTAREMIDSLSGTLLCDERILSVPERELLANLLQRTRNQLSAPDNTVAEVITHTVGEIIVNELWGCWEKACPANCSSSSWDCLPVSSTETGL